MSGYRQHPVYYTCVSNVSSNKKEKSNVLVHFIGKWKGDQYLSDIGCLTMVLERRDS